MTLDKLNKLASGDYNNVSISKLNPNQVYMVTDIKKVFNQYGERIVLQLDYDFDTFLPQRHIDFLLGDEKYLDDMTEKARNSQIGLIHHGEFKIQFVNLPKLYSDFMKSDEFKKHKSNYLDSL